MKLPRLPRLPDRLRRGKQQAGDGAGPTFDQFGHDESRRMSVRDLLEEALAGLVARPARVMLTVLGTVIGVGALVATLGLSKTAGSQIVGRFSEVAATDVSVVPSAKAGGPKGIVLPFDAEYRLKRLNGVAAAGTLAEVDVRGALMRSVPVNDPRRAPLVQLPVKAASAGAFRAVRATLGSGRFFDAGHSARGDRVLVLGRNAARELKISGLDDQPAVFIGDRVYTVIGILDNVERQTSLLSAAIMPQGTARGEFGLKAPGTAQIETRVGAVELIARQAPLSLSPGNTALLKVNAPPDPRLLKSSIKKDLQALFLLLGGVSLLVGAIGIANVTLVSVLERVGEIGLRRALGAARRHIAAQFLLESTAMGLAGGVIGASLGIFVIVGVSAMQTWTPVLDPWIPVGAPVLGALIGLLSGTYPSLRAASLEPVEALRAGT
jgi:ABC-type antimicrobial peptide transport system permease subunit